MPRFRTTVTIPEFPVTFHHQTPVLSIGSCFAEHISARLDTAKCSSLLNPFGILYNPISIANTLNYLLDSQSYRQDQLVYDQGLWHSLDHHGQFSRPSAEATLNGLNSSLKDARSFLSTTKRLLLTFGTSKVYTYNSTGQVVANCHKIPANQFDRKDISVKEIVKKLQDTFSQLKRVIPDLEIILTVSPIRHIRDGMVEQQRSKARLILACGDLSNAFEYVHYFPSYEIMIDELRDYRFYEADMIHPNKVAIEYIWDHFRRCFFSPETNGLIDRISKIQKASQHRPFNPASEEHQAFIKKQIDSIELMEQAYKFLDFTIERSALLKEVV